MDRSQADKLADEVRLSMSETSAPVDVFRIAREEPILLAPGDYGPNFDGRIEFHRRHGKFILFYPRPGGAVSDGRIRFSVGHELGHYYIPQHRQLLLQGRSHISSAGFLCDNRLEREADQFAASLLIPSQFVEDLIYRRKFLTLKDVLALADTFHASRTCAAIRYVELAPTPCAVVLSASGMVRFYIASEDARYRGFRWLGQRTIPHGSYTAKASTNAGASTIFEGESHTECWFSERRRAVKLWEEAVALGYTGLTLTILGFEFADEE